MTDDTTDTDDSNREELPDETELGDSVDGETPGDYVTPDGVGFDVDETGLTVRSADGEEVATFAIEDLDVSVDTHLDPEDALGMTHDEIREHLDADRAVSMTIELDAADRTTCPYCGKLNEIPDPALLTRLELDAPCERCGRRLEVVR